MDGMAELLDEQCDVTCTGREIDSVNLGQARMEEQTADILAELFKALGDPTRVKIIYALLHNELCVHDICKMLEMNQSAVSHQLRYLRNVRMVKRRKVGKTVYYLLDDEHVREVFIQTMEHLKHG